MSKLLMLNQCLKNQLNQRMTRDLKMTASENNLEMLVERLAARLQEDIPLSKTREEHIRVTARANEAAELLTVIKAASANTVL
jgi:hypothetical protein